MNFYYIFTYFAAVFIMVTVFVNSVEAYEGQEDRSKSQEQLNAFRNASYNTIKHLKILENLARSNDEQDRRQCRQALDAPSNSASKDNENTEEEEIVSNCNPEYCKAHNCGAGGIWCSDRSKFFLKPSKELNNFLSNLREENKKMPREICLHENEQNKEEGNEKEVEKVSEKGTTKQKKSEKKENRPTERESIGKAKSGSKIGVKGFKSKTYLWPHEGKSKYRMDDNILFTPENEQTQEFFNDDNAMSLKENSDRVNSDLSSCQHCSEHIDNGKFKNNKLKSKKVLLEVQPFLQSFKQKYAIGGPEDADDEDDEEGEKDVLFKIKYPSVVLTNTKEGNENSIPNSNSTAFSLLPAFNDQLDSSKNNLSHEANYKLSKDEQDASEDKRDFGWKWSIFKRSHPFNAMHEIKLKTSSRLMNKGFGASLPSYALKDSQRELYIDYMLKRKQREMLRAQKNGKYMNLNQPIEENNKQSEDFVDAPLEQGLSSQPLKYYNFYTQKKISDENAYKNNFFDNPDLAGSLSSSANNRNNYKAESDYISNLKPFRRRKRSIQFANSDISQKSDYLNICSTIDQTSLEPVENHTKALKILKRFNPAKTLQLQIYKKFHSPKTLKHNKSQRQRIKELLKHERVKEELRMRSLQPSLFMAKSSAGNNNLIITLTKKLLKKAQNIQKHIKAFVKKSTTYLPFQMQCTKTINLLNSSNESSSDSKALNTSKFYKIIDAGIINNKQLTNEKAENKSFKDNITKSLNKLKKLTFLKEQLDKLLNLNDKNLQQYNKVRLTRSVRSLSVFQEKYSRNRNNSRKKMKSKYKHFWDTTNNTGIHKSFLAALLNHSDESVSSMYKLLNSSQCQSQDHETQQEKPGIGYFVMNKSKLKEKPENTEQRLNLNENFKLKKNSHKGNFYPLEVNDKTQNSKSLKRCKRSLKQNFSKDRYKFNKTKLFEKRILSTNYGALYKPNFQQDISYAQPASFYDPKKLYVQQKQPITLESDKTHGEYNFQTLPKPFLFENFDNFKGSLPESQKFEGMKFDNLWYDDKSQKYIFQPQKRFAKTANSSITRSLRKHYKRHSIIIDKNTHQHEPKPAKSISKVQLLKDKYLKDLHNFNKNYKFNEHSSKWRPANTKTNTNSNHSFSDNSGKSRVDSSNEILNCKAFASLEDFIKSLPKNLTDSLLNGVTDECILNSDNTEKNEMDEVTPIETEEETTCVAPVMEHTIACTTAPAGGEEENEKDEEKVECDETTVESTEDNSESNDIDMEEVTESSTQEEDETENIPEDNMSTECVLPSNSATSADQDDVKLNITINANVQGNPKYNRYCANGSFHVLPGLLDERQRRNIILLPLDSASKSKTLHFANQRSNDEESNEDLSDLYSGKFSSNVVRSILNAVQENPQLKALWPSLKRNQYPEQINNNQSNFYPIRDESNEQELQNAEKLIAEVMSSINNIIERTVRSQACMPLRPDLQEFYNMIIRSRQQQDMVREKSQLTPTTKSEDFSYKIHLLDPNKIDEETKIVKKLLTQYEELPRQDQQQLGAVRDDLFKNLIILRQLQDDQKQHSSELREKREYAWDKSVEEVMESLESQYTPEFLKLLKAAELYREISSE